VIYSSGKSTVQLFQRVPVKNLITDFILAHTSPDGFSITLRYVPGILTDSAIMPHFLEGIN
ncbi:hypothetical protein WI617_20505, partial [Salmonella enterica subsp. enterica serovar Corvallis]